MGLFSKPKIKLPPLPTLGPQGKQFQAEMYPMLEGALGGGGLYTDIRHQTYGSLLDAIRKESPKIKADMLGMLNRMVPRSDLKVREAAINQLQESKARTIEYAKSLLTGPGAAEGERFEALDMSLGNLGNEVGMAEQLGNMEYGAQSQSYQSPTFGGRLGAGLGSAAGWWLGSQGNNTGGGIGSQTIPQQGAGWRPGGSLSLSNSPAVIEFSNQMAMNRLQL